MPDFPAAARRSLVVPLSAALALATGMGTWYVLDGGPLTAPGGAAPAAGSGPGVAAVARSLHLPGPAEGQTSVEAEGIGGLGTRGEQRPVPIASVTKVMTAYVILKDHPMRAGAPGAALTADEQAANESYSSVETTAPVLAGRTYTQRRLLEMMMVPSGNNIARLPARWDAGGEKAFVVKMNEAAAALEGSAAAHEASRALITEIRATPPDAVGRSARA